MPGPTEKTPLKATSPPFLAPGPARIPAIGYFGSLAIAVNNLTGPGMLDLPATFQKSGFIPTTICIIIVSVLSSLTSLALTAAISRMPNNARFTQNIEYSNVFGFYMSKTWFILTQVLFAGCVLAQMVASIISTAQVVDAFVATGHGTTYALDMSTFPPSVVSWSDGFCDDVDSGCLPFSPSGYSKFIVSLGYVITCVLLLPLCLMDMKDNVNAQLLSFVLLLVFLVEFVWSFFNTGFHRENFKWFGSEWKELLGVVLFNFSLTATMPAWLHEKRTDLEPGKIIWSSNAIVVVLYCIVGMTGSMSIKHIPPNFLAYLSAGHQGNLTQVCANLFSFFIIGFGIPLFCIIMRYNLVNAGLASHRVGSFLTSVLPWLLSWMLYQGEGIIEVFAWGGLVLNGLIGFILPLVVALYAVRRKKLAVDTAREIDRANSSTEDAHPIFSARPKSTSLYHWGSLDDDEEDHEKDEEEGEQYKYVDSDSEDEAGDVEGEDGIQMFPSFLGFDDIDTEYSAVKGILFVTIIAVVGAVANKVDFGVL
jgi:amino acid permease